MNSPSTLAVIDIGSNTILATVGRRTSSGEIEILLDEGDVVRMGQGLSDGGLLDPEAKQRVMTALRRFQALAQAHGATQIIAAGTAAFRRARDGRDFAREIEQRLGIPVRILSGDEEARYSFASAWFDFGKGLESLGMIDIGGGSTEFVFGPQGPRFSLPLGTVELTEKWIRHHPIPDIEWNPLQAEIRTLLGAHLPKRPDRPEAWVAVAATPASLAAVLLRLSRYQPEKIHGFRLTQERLSPLVEELRAKGLAERRAMPGMHPQRAELLPIGGAILSEAMRCLEIGEVVVSDHGLRYGLLQESLVNYAV